MLGTLYLVGTPIGNRKDITLRALETLKSVDVVACEDTRHTRSLLEHYEIKKPLISYYREKEKEGAQEILKYLETGKSVAIVTDAGMPAISDPGAVAVREARKAGIPMQCVPGPTAVASAVSLVGTDGGFAFLGFLPEKKKDRETLLQAYCHTPLPLVFYCAPHDLESTAACLRENLGNRKLYAVKEITKVFETVYEGNLENPAIENAKGEFVLVVEGGKPAKTDPVSLVSELMKEGFSHSEAVKEAAKITGCNKKELYAKTLTSRGTTDK